MPRQKFFAHRVAKAKLPEGATRRRGRTTLLGAAMICATLSACVVTENSSTGDRSRYGAKPVAPAGNSPRPDAGGEGSGTSTAPMPFEAFRSSISRNCMPCHAAGSDDGDFDLATEADWRASVDAGIVAGSPDASALVQALKQNGGGMPKRRPAISDADYRAIREWIAGLR